MSKSSDNDLLFVVLGLALILPSAVWSGYALTKLWASRSA